MIYQPELQEIVHQIKPLQNMVGLRLRNGALLTDLNSPGVFLLLSNKIILFVHVICFFTFVSCLSCVLCSFLLDCTCILKVSIFIGPYLPLLPSPLFLPCPLMYSQNAVHLDCVQFLFFIVLLPVPSYFFFYLQCSEEVPDDIYYYFFVIGLSPGVFCHPCSFGYGHPGSSDQEFRIINVEEVGFFEQCPPLMILP